jgi:hypothetical protein
VGIKVGYQNADAELETMGGRVDGYFEVMGIRVVCVGGKAGEGKGSFVFGLAG